MVEAELPLAGEGALCLLVHEASRLEAAKVLGGGEVAPSQSPGGPVPEDVAHDRRDLGGAFRIGWKQIKSCGDEGPERARNACVEALVGCHGGDLFEKKRAARAALDDRGPSVVGPRASKERE
jgi:hypothetical protein